LGEKGMPEKCRAQFLRGRPGPREKGPFKGKGKGKPPKIKRDSEPAKGGGHKAGPFI